MCFVSPPSWKNRVGPPRAKPGLACIHVARLGADGFICFLFFIILDVCIFAELLDSNVNKVGARGGAPSLSPPGTFVLARTDRVFAL